MELLLDTANLDAIRQGVQTLPLAGVTTNPFIVKKEGKIDFFSHMRTIRQIIGKERSLHIQVVAKDRDGMLKDAETILQEIDSEVFIKVPVTEQGLEVIKILKQRGVSVTATAIYTKFQAYLAIAAGADYVAPYYNRMENLNIDPCDVIRQIAVEIDRTNSATKILAASFKNIAQINHSIENGAQSATMGSEIIHQAFAMPSIAKAVDDFAEDWESIFGSGKTISDL